eukprot:s236_g6.t1
MLAGLRGANCDVQVPYRLPYACPTCGDHLTAQERQQISLAAQRAQDAQTGYCADYCSKSQPMGHGEIKEFQKGHEQLHAQYRGKSLDDVGKRHANRFLSDAYLKGIVRGQVECCNLRAHHRESAVVSAERIATTTFESFPGAAFAEFVAMYHSEAANAPATKRSTSRWTRRQASGVRHLGTVDIVQVYGHRPVASEVWWLSPYEFVAQWAITLPRVPTTQREWNQEASTSWDVSLTPTGLQYLRKQTDPDKKVQLQPGQHYRLAVEWTAHRIGLPETTATSQLRHRGLQGVTELVRCERTQDVWLQELQAELRIGHLRLLLVRFLHGRPTKVPGSWCTMTQQPTCGETLCHRLYKHGSTPATIRKYECAICRAERDSKRLVAVDAKDPRFTAAFSLARGIFHTNGVKCHVNKLRAEEWARKHGQVIHYAVATDKVSSRALHEKPDIAQDKLFGCSAATLTAAIVMASLLFALVCLCKRGNTSTARASRS